MRDIFDFFATEAPAGSELTQQLTEAARANDWASVGPLLRDALRAEDSEAVAAVLLLEGGPELASKLVEAIFSLDTEGPSVTFWSGLSLEDPTRVPALRDALDRSGLPSTATSEACWLGLGVHVLRGALASEDEKALLAAGRETIAHAERSLGRTHPLATAAALTVTDAYLSSERAPHWREGEEIARSMLDCADEEARIQASFDLGCALALQHRWSDAMATWADLPAGAIRPHGVGPIGRHRLADDVHGVVSKTRMDLAMSLRGSRVAPLLARCEYQLADRNGLDDAVTAEAAEELRRDATSRLARWLPLEEPGPELVDTLVDLATMDSPTCVRSEVYELAARCLDDALRSELEARIGETLGRIAENLAFDAGNDGIDPEFAEACLRRFRHRARLEGLAEETSALERLFEPSIRLVEQPSATGRSRLGGPPELPDDFDVESGGGEPRLAELRLAALLDLDELRATGVRTMERLPQSGTLCFFFAPRAAKGVGRVLYFAQGTALRPRPELAHEPAVALTFEGRRIEQLPPLRTPFYAALLEDAGDGDVVAGAASRVQGVALPYGHVSVRPDSPSDQPPMHRFGGYADPVACDPYAAAAIGAARPPASATTRGQALEATRWRSVLQLDFSGSSLAPSETPGVLSFLIRDDDLAAQRFDRAHAVWQPR